MFDKDISKMDFKELRSAVQTLYDAYEIMRRKYEDAINNLDSDNFSDGYTVEQNNMKAQVQITADAIKTMVSKADLKSALSAYSTLKQTADAIETVVSKGASLGDAEEVNSSSEMVDTDKVYVIRNTDEDGNILSEKYYYYNDLSEEWQVLSGDSIYTLFEQTAEGFKLRGNVLISGDVTLKSLAWYTKMFGDKLVLCDGNGNVKLEFGTKKGCIEKMQKGLWIGDSSVYNYEGEYPGGNTAPTDGAETLLGTGIFFDFESSRIFAYKSGLISEIGSGNAVFG